MRLSLRGSQTRLSLRILAVFEGIVGALIGFAISIVASVLRVIGGAAGISTDEAHFFLAIALSLLAFIGALLAIGPGLAAAICLLVAAVGFFFVAGWWAIVPALFLLPAAWLAFASRTSEIAPAAALQPQPTVAQPQPTITEAPRQPSMAESRSYAEAPTLTAPTRSATSEARSYAEAPTIEMPPPAAPAAEAPAAEAPAAEAPAAEAPAAEAPATEAPPQPAAAEPVEQPVAAEPPQPVQPEPQPRREAQRLTEPPPETTPPGAPA